MSDPARALQDAIRDQLTAAARREPDPSRTAHTALRDALVATARDEQVAVAPALQRRHRRRWHAAGAIALVAFGIAAAAEATRLISVGAPISPSTERRAGQASIAPSTLGVDLVATARDPARQLLWGVGVYRSADGRDCALPGQVRGRTLGLEERGRFRPYSTLKGGACGDLAKLPVFLDRLLIRAEPPRSIVYGRTATPGIPVKISLRGGRPRTAPPGRGGGFLLVFDGVVDPSELDVLPNTP